jgi:hypothetical protein
MEVVTMKKYRVFIITAIMMCVLGILYVNAEENETEIDTPEVTTEVTTSIEETEPTTEVIVTSNSEITTTVTDTTETTVSETTPVFTTPVITTTAEPDVPGRVVGDTNNDGKLNIRDAAFIARKLAQQKADELSVKWADYNNDEVVNVRDAASIARYLAKKSAEETEKTHETYSQPKKKDYNLKDFDGLKSYVNDYIVYKAATQYGIKYIIFDDSVDVWEYSWNVPDVYVPNVDYYLGQNDGILEIGSYLYKLPQNYIDDGWEQCFHVAKNESEMADMLTNGASVDMKMMFDEIFTQYTTNKNLSADESKYLISCMNITVAWKPLGGGNYELYWMWGGPIE